MLTVIAIGLGLYCLATTAYGGVFTVAGLRNSARNDAADVLFICWNVCVAVGGGLGVLGAIALIVSVNH